MVCMAVAFLFLISVFSFSQVSTKRNHEVTASLHGGHSLHSSSHSPPLTGLPLVRWDPASGVCSPQSTQGLLAVPGVRGLLLGSAIPAPHAPWDSEVSWLDN